MKKIILLSSVFIVFSTITYCGINSMFGKSDKIKEYSENKNIPDQKNKKTKIQVAILLDTSSSMDGLIEQAKSCLWNIINTLTTLKYNGETPQIEISVYEYGNDRIHTRENDYIRQVAPLTTDLDLISEKLFALTTNGGSEYCGAVIKKASTELKWSGESADMKLIYIAGNEPFTQGKISYKSAIDVALGKNIYINTIHCGYPDEGIRGMWKDGAITGKGKFFNINHNNRIVYIDTPYDIEISKCNERLNSTYISYGSKGHERQENQKKQDMNAESISYANYVERTVSKSKAAYDNSSWDLVDMAKSDKELINNIKNKDLPAEYQNMSKEELAALISQKESERIEIQKEIAKLAKKRQEYIESQNNNNADDDFGKAVNESILEFAKNKGYIVEL